MALLQVILLRVCITVHRNFVFATKIEHLDKILYKGLYNSLKGSI